MTQHSNNVSSNNVGSDDFSGNRVSGSNAGSDNLDVVIVGGGAAGLNAALVLARARRRVALLDSGEPRNAPAVHMHGFLSRDGMPPADLRAAGRAEIERYGGDLIDGRVESVERIERLAGTVRGFVVRLAGGRALRARRIVMATGLRDELPAIPGVRERWGRDVLHCPYCHGYEVADQPIGVIADQPLALHQALLLRQWSHDVVYFAHGADVSADAREQLAARGIRVVEGQVGGLVVGDDDRLAGVGMADGRVVPRAAVFVPPRFIPNDALLTGLGCEKDAAGFVVTDASGRTSVPGVWAAGNVADPRAQVITAAGQGSAAAIALNGDLLEEDVDREVHDHRRALAVSP
ncbi:NAD(P)/FAD-dependent oxidoreductase [Streptomyces piniterrae]|uniref:NAD(P)/FAD-dependent oxidoreductase n=1 Tax=Streptomyces piniterrae TaxID=2571125 RepID=A0A4U0MV44_9ACTN|nr:NAD(P)/FAD-dependent oxidoreductase [Streptomyces piniterrae]TJZ44432.1 NAD(P)/FAD-dependent oxidoreductase [Streptomyces piniterrae]